MDNELKKAFELILNCNIHHGDGEVYHHYYWDEYILDFIGEYLTKEALELIPNGIIEPWKDEPSMYEKYFIDLNNSFIMIDEEYDFFSEFGEEVVNAAMEEKIFIGETPYLKGSSLIDIIKKFDIDMNNSEDFEYATIVVRVHTDGTLYSALCSLFCATYGYEDIMDIDDPIEKLDEKWKTVFEKIEEPLKSHLACFFLNEYAARCEGACYSNGINNGGFLSEFIFNKTNKCLIQLDYGEGQASSFILKSGR
ncbi:hypothetical protein NNC19_17090 [Clostridium sp. SHJSY1]|uniref:hypothetical protein n=1 Tax=Clostridium sp. SHJSY1 TaxID=2942483 RepID=UPI0028760F78|nr:hypothetical protein [Clostridium sp. SHJSY1]MDS0527409.1 hypothetical protein [Clostridium sp. SHJSY1]